MRAIIFNSDRKKPYESIVLALEHSNNNLYYYVINPDEVIERIPDAGEYPVLPFEQIVAIRNGDHPIGNWVRENNLDGYDWFIKDKKNIELINDEKEIDIKFLNQCLLQNKVELDWYHKNKNDNEIKNRSDLLEFKRFVSHFDLGEIDKIEWDYSDYRNATIYVSISMPYFKNITLIFSDVTDAVINCFVSGINREVESSILEFVKDDEICFDFANGYINAKKLSFTYDICVSDCMVLYVNPKVLE